MSWAHPLPRAAAATLVGSLLLPGSPLVPSPAAASGGPVDGSGSHYLLRSSHTAGAPDLAYPFGSPRDEVLVGDWDGDGADTLGVRRGNAFSLKNTHAGGDADLLYAFGSAGDSVLVGDWDGDGVDTVGVRRGNTVHLANSHLGGDADLVYSLGSPGDAMLVGDWDGDGSDTLGLRRGSRVLLWNSHRGGAPDVTLVFGRPGDVVLVGDWDGDGVDTLAVRRGSTFHLAASSGDGLPLSYSYGSAQDAPLAGDWDGNGTDTVGVRRVQPHPLVDPLRVRMVDLGTFGGASSTPVAVNDRGQVVGQAQARDGSWRPFLWERGRLTDLSPALPGARARDLNNRGEVVLSRDSGEAPERSVLWTRDGGVVRLGQVEAVRVDEHGRVAGNVSRVDDDGRWNRNPFLWTADGRADMGPVPRWQGRDSRFVDMNDDGAVLGIGLDEDGRERAFLWSDGAVSPVTRRFGDFVNSAVDVNNRREVLGSDVAPSRSGTSSAYVRDAGGLPGLVRFSARQQVSPAALNEHGQVTGSLHLGIGRRPEHAFLWTGERLVAIGPAGEASRGVAVNDRAQVAGEVERPVAGAGLDVAAFVWQAGRSIVLPVPESTAASEATAVSEAGHVIGTITDRAGARRAVMWVLGD